MLMMRLPLFSNKYPVITAINVSLSHVCVYVCYDIGVMR